jgi:hypothetical protein
MSEVQRQREEEYAAQWLAEATSGLSSASEMTVCGVGIERLPRAALVDALRLLNAPWGSRHLAIVGT